MTELDDWMPPDPWWTTPRWEAAGRFLIVVAVIFAVAGVAHVVEVLSRW